MLICTEAWSLAVMTLFVAELQEQKENTAQQPQQHKHQSMQKQMRKFFFLRKANKKVGARLATYWGHRGPPSYPPRSAW